MSTVYRQWAALSCLFWGLLRCPPAGGLRIIDATPASLDDSKGRAAPSQLWAMRPGLRRHRGESEARSRNTAIGPIAEAREKFEDAITPPIPMPTTKPEFRWREPHDLIDAVLTAGGYASDAVAATAINTAVGAGVAADSGAKIVTEIVKDVTEPIVSPLVEGLNNATVGVARGSSAVAICTGRILPQVAKIGSSLLRIVKNSALPMSQGVLCHGSDTKTCMRVAFMVADNLIESLGYLSNAMSACLNMSFLAHAMNGSANVIPETLPVGAEGSMDSCLKYKTDLLSFIPGMAHDAFYLQSTCTHTVDNTYRNASFYSMPCPYEIAAISLDAFYSLGRLVASATEFYTMRCEHPQAATDRPMACLGGMSLFLEVASSFIGAMLKGLAKCGPGKKADNPDHYSNYEKDLLCWNGIFTMVGQLVKGTRAVTYINALHCE